jgi:hypothetical protein
VTPQPGPRNLDHQFSNSLVLPLRLIPCSRTLSPLLYGVGVSPTRSRYFPPVLKLPPAEQFHHKYPTRSQPDSHQLLQPPHLLDGGILPFCRRFTLSGPLNHGTHFPKRSPPTIGPWLLTENCESAS